MKCRPGCGACCIFPSISSPIPGLPDGKAEMTPCPHLLPDMSCAIFGQPERPRVCAGFRPEYEICGNSPEEAAKNFRWLLSPK